MVLLSWLVASTAIAGEVLVVEEVEIEGLERTKRYVVEREYAFDVGQPARMEDVEKTERRLGNLPMFNRVNIEVEFIDEPLARLRIEVDEQWTLVPTGNFRITDDVRLFRVGARDVNLLGRSLETGVVYEWRSGVHSGEGWFRYPRLFGRRLELGVEGAYRNRVFTLYDDEGQVEGGFLLRNIAVEVELQQEFRPWLYGGGRLEVTDDAAGLRSVGEAIEEVQRQEDLPAPTTLIRPGVLVQLGRIDDEGFLADGISWETVVDGASRHLGSTESFLEVNSQLNFARTLPLRSLFISRLSVGATGAETEYYRLFVGGLDEVRGFRDMRFRGNRRIFANLEYRIPSVVTDWVVLQHLLFVDAASVADEWADMRRIDAVSTGVGLRIKSPKIHSLVIRIDVARSLHGDGRSPWSFGGNQFF